MAFIADMSEYQPENVNFNQLKGQVDLVILRDQFGYSKKDSKYDSYVSGCKAAGIPFDTYAFFDAVSVTDAQAEAASDIQRMAKDSVVAWIDIETVSVKSGKDADLIAAGNAYYDALKKAGFQKVGLYSGEYFYNEHSLAQVKKDCLWLAKYNANDGTLDLSKRPAVACDLWQFTSVGKLNGVTGNLDLSVLVGAKPESYFTGITPVVAPPIPEVFCKSSQVIAKIQSVVNNDIRKAPSHKAEFVRNSAANETFDAYERVTNENDTWWGVGGTNWICSNGGENVKVLSYVNMPKPVPSPTPAPVAPPAQAEVKAPGPLQAPSPKQYNVVIPNLRGFSLGAVHEYIVDKGWGYTATENKDGTISIEVGIFKEGAAGLIAFEAYLETEKFAYSLKETTV